MAEITKKMLIGDVVKEYPKSVEIMMEHGMQCVGCHVATWETIEQGATGHGIDIDQLIKDLNKKVGR
jgi:hybrid cluster-associated redox disulfide protein